MIMEEDDGIWKKKEGVLKMVEMVMKEDGREVRISKWRRRTFF